MKKLLCSCGRGINQPDRTGSLCHRCVKGCNNSNKKSLPLELDNQVLNMVIPVLPMLLRESKWLRPSAS